MESFTGRREAASESAEWTHARDRDHLEVAVRDPLDPHALAAPGPSVKRALAPRPATPELHRAMARAHPHEGASAANLAIEDSAAQVLTGAQLACALLALGLVAGAVAWWPRPAVVGLAAAAVGFYVVSSLFRLFLIVLSVGSRREMVVEPQEAGRLAEDGLPLYTVLVPLSHEARMIDQLVTALSRLDYPPSRLEVLLLLEADDTETRAAVDAVALPSHMRVLLVPAGEPRGKPRALNHGLLHARGEYCAIYDAEDVPDPDQLRKAVVAFSRAGDDVVCVQSKLNFYNGEQNILTRLFTLDYAMWFEFVLPGLFALDAPIPLGGTSNHFKVDTLRRVGAWDRFNVTEDADLGIRLYRHRYRTIMVDSLTREEANSQLWNWIRQRTHWTKGYMLTYLVHMRRPLRLRRELGTLGFISTQLLIGGTVVVQLLNPVFWILLGVWCATRWGALSTIFTGPMLYAGSVLVFGATFSFIFSATLSSLRTGQYWAAKYTPLLPLYWALASFASYRALVQLVTSPHHWEKTRHGLFLPADLDTRGGQDLRHSPVATRPASPAEADGAGS